MLNDAVLHKMRLKGLRNEYKTLLSVVSGPGKPILHMQKLVQLPTLIKYYEDLLVDNTINTLYTSPYQQY